MNNYARAEETDMTDNIKEENRTITRGARVRAYLTAQGISLSPKLYFVTALGALAQGLFATLLIGTIFGTVYKYIPWTIFLNIKTFATAACGAVLGIAVARALDAPPLILFSAGVVGHASNALGATIDGASVTAGPAGAFLCVLVAVEVGKLVSRRTKVDILVTPTVTILAGVGLAMLICPAIAYLMYWIGHFVQYATEVQPLLMGIVISVVVGVILTLPISSAAICAMIGISGLAGGAAAVGCCAQMVGFAVISFRENRWSGLVAQGLGTSMLQMGNIVRNPRIWIPATLAAAVTGPLSTCVFKLCCEGVSAGMGTCGLVGPLGIIAATDGGPLMWVGLVLLCFILPALLSLLFAAVLRRIGWIRENDMKLDL